MELGEIEKLIRTSLEVDNENVGVKVVRKMNIEELTNVGIKDISAFLDGTLDAENDEEFSGTCEDYIKGFKYGTTGTF